VPGRVRCHDGAQVDLVGLGEQSQVGHGPLVVGLDAAVGRQQDGRRRGGTADERGQGQGE
jgi:hypothetical protein